MLIDSHCHIDGDSFDEDRDEVVQRAKDTGVAAMLVVGTGDPHSDDFRKAVVVAERYENVYGSVGVHPHDAKLYDDEAEKHLTELTKSEKVIAWGEIGLDFYTITARATCSAKFSGDRFARRLNSIFRSSSTVEMRMMRPLRF